MKNVLERRKGRASNLTNLGLVHQRLVEQAGRILFFLFLLLGAAGSFLAIDLLLRHGARDVEPHFHELVSSRGRFSPSILGLARLVSIHAILPGLQAQVEFDRDFILTRQIRVRNFGIWNLERRSILHVKCELGSPELGLAPVPPSQRMLLVFQIDPIPDLERFRHPIKILLLEAVQLDDGRVSRDDLEFVAL